MKAKRFFGVLLAVLMLVSCFAISASADKTVIIDESKKGSLTIHLFGADSVDADLNATNESTFSNAEDDKGESGQSVPAGYTALSGSTFKITRIKDAKGAAVEGGATYTQNTTSGVATFSNLEVGQYKVENTKIASNQGGPVATFYVNVPMTVKAGDDLNYDVHVYPKVPTTTNPTITKTVKGSNDSSYGTKASIDKNHGEYANWKIDVNVPADVANYSKFVVTDGINTTYLTLYGTAPKGNVSVSVSGVDTLSDAFKDSFDISVTDSNITLTVNDFAKFAAVAAGKTLSITFDTTINNGSESKLIPNDAELTYVNADNTNNVITGLANVPGYDPENPTKVPDGYTQDPDDPTKYYKEDKIDNNGGDPDDDPTTTAGHDDPTDDTSPTHSADPYIYTAVLNVEKYFGDTTSTDKATSNTDVQFTLTSKTDSTKTCTGSWSNGTYKFVGLDDDTYVLTETFVKDGYELLGYQVEVKIDETHLNGELKTTNLTNLVKFENNTLKIYNPDSPKLPLTGGMGVGMFAVLGLALAAVGGVYLFKTRKVGAR